MTVQTKLGPIRGLRRHHVELFRSVYYAEPPVGKLRFMPAVPKRAWGPAAPMDATAGGPSCWQDGESRNRSRFWSGGKRHSDESSEDCLWLEVWRPRNVTDRDR